MGSGKNGTGKNGAGENGTRKKWLPELTAPEKMAPGNNGRVPNLESAVCTREKKRHGKICDMFVCVTFVFIRFFKFDFYHRLQCHICFYKVF